MSGSERSQRNPAAVWVVAGAPGSGKSTAADILVRMLDPVPALLDKDTLFTGFVEEVQRAYGRAVGQREGSWYDTHVKVHEYDGLTAAAAQIRAAGCPVLLVAPFTGQIRDPERWASWVAALGGEPVHLVWVRCDGPTLRDRLRTRRAVRDGGKLADYEEFLARSEPDVPPPVPHVEVDGCGDAAAVTRRLAHIAGA